MFIKLRSTLMIELLKLSMLGLQDLRHASGIAKMLKYSKHPFETFQKDTLLF